MLGLFSSMVFLGPAQRRLIRKGSPVYMYHKIATPAASTTDPFLYTTPEEFERQLGALATGGFAPATLSGVAAEGFGKNSRAVITFDDGCLNVLQAGLPILVRRGFRAIQFLVAGSLGKTNAWDVAKGDVPEPLMSESQVREWLAAGQVIGSHSMTHRNLRHLRPQELREEIMGSRKSLEDRFGTPVEHFSYPYGSWNEAVRDLVMEAGYKTACTASFGVNPPGTSALEIRRIIPLSERELIRKFIHRATRRNHRKAMPA